MVLLTGQIQVLSIEDHEYEPNAISIWIMDLDNDLDGSDGCEPAGRMMPLQHQLCKSY